MAVNLTKFDAALDKELGDGPPPPWKHQEKTFAFASNHDLVFDSSDPGTGKTRAHIDVVADRLERSTASGVLVVCPKSLMEPAWKKDFFEFSPATRLSLAFAENREEAFDKPAPVYVVNSDGVKWLESKGKRWMKKRFGLNPQLIIDESTSFKNYNSDRSRAMRKVAKHFELRTMMSGTPITSSIIDIWHQMFILDRGETFGTSLTRFRQQTQVNIGAHFAKWVDIPGIEEVIAAAMKHLTVRHRFNEVMDVPENFSRTIDIQLSKKHLAQYNQLKKEAYVQLKDGKVDAVNAAVLRNKLLQLASGAVYDGEGYAHVLDPQRYELVADMVGEREASVVFINWRHQRDSIIKELNKRGLKNATLDGSVPNSERAGIVEDFQAGNLRAIIMHPATGAHGLTLTRGRTTIWASPTDHPDFFIQGKHRVYRGGQKHKTENIVILGEGTLERRVFNQTHTKHGRIVNLLDILEE